MEKIKTSYKKDGYTLETKRAIVKIGGRDGEVFPYDMLLGALSSCFYYTLLEILEKRKAEIPEIEIVVTVKTRKSSNHVRLGEYGYHRPCRCGPGTILTLRGPGCQVLLNP
jgi:uncharacterized OsmC-like protein